MVWRIWELDLLPAILLNFMIGAFWYGPLFGELYQKSLRISTADMEKIQAKGMSSIYLLELLGNVLFVVCYKALIVHFRLVSLEQILGLGLTILLGFVVPTLLSPIIWEGKSKTLLWISAGNKFVSILLVGNVFCIF